MTFAAWLRDRRRETRLSQGAVASYVGVHRVTVQKWERGLARPDATLLLALCGALGVEARELLSHLDAERRETFARGEPVRGRRKEPAP